MKKVTLTNATVIPFYNRDKDAPIKVLQVMDKKPEFKSQMLKFNVETPVDDNPEKRGKLFEKCTFYARNDAQVEEMRNTIKNGALVEIIGKEVQIKSPKDEKYYPNIIVSEIKPISAAVEDGNVDSQVNPDDDLPF